MDTYTRKDGQTFKVGDVIRAYAKGVHVITSIEDRGAGASPLVYYKRILNSTMKPGGGKSRCCISFCKHVTVDTIKQELEEIKQTYENAVGIIIKNS